MKIYALLFLLAASVLAACSSSAPQPSANNTANTAVTNAAPTVQTSIAPSAASPMETMRALNEAAKSKNVEALKNLVSKGTLKLLEENAAQQATTVDELLRKDNGAPFEELPEMRNEKIEGERATVEVENQETEEWTTLPFVKENGAWKIALDEYVEEVRKKMVEEMKPPANNSKKK